MKIENLLLLGLVGVAAYIVIKGINLTGSPFGLFTYSGINPAIKQLVGNCPPGQAMQYSIAGAPVGCVDARLLQTIVS